MDQFQVRKAETDEQIREIADLANVIWNEHFTPIIGREQVEYMVEKFQSYPALKEQIAEGYEYYQIIHDGESCGYTGIHPGEDNRLFLSKLYIKKRKQGAASGHKDIRFLKGSLPGTRIFRGLAHLQ